MQSTLLLVALYYGPAVPEASALDAPTVAALIRDLGDDDFDLRERAEARFAHCPAATRSLIRAAGGKDPEIAYRADRILRKHFDAVDYGAGGKAAPRLVDAAGKRTWRAERVVTKSGNKTTEHWVTTWLPDAGPELTLAEKYGRFVMIERGDTPGRPGSRDNDDPLSGHVQQAATVRYLRELQADGVHPLVIKQMVADLDWAAIADN